MSEETGKIGNEFDAAMMLRLLRSVAEQLKMPLITIARQAELASLVVPLRMEQQEIALARSARAGNKLAADDSDLQVIARQAATALRLVDSYLMGLELTAGQEACALEPVSAASVLTDVAHELHGFARQYEVALEVHIAGRYEPVVANRMALQAALSGVGYELIAAQAAQPDVDENGKRRARRLVLASHRAGGGIVAGMYGESVLIDAASARRAFELHGRARQPFSALTSGGGAGIFVADTLLQTMAAHLRAGRYNKQRGFAVTLQPSRQLQLV